MSEAEAPDSLDEFSELDMEILRQVISDEESPEQPESKEEKPKRPPKPVPRLQLTDDEAADLVESIIRDFPRFVRTSKHWSLTLVSIIGKLNYKPPSALVANVHRYDPSECSALKLVSSHLSGEMMNDIIEKIRDSYEVEALVDDEPAEINENSYLEHKTEVETKAGSIDKEGWASW